MKQKKKTEELTTPFANKGCPLDLSPRQQSQKVKELKTKASSALFFAKSLGLMTASLELLSTTNGTTVKLSLQSPHQNTPIPSPLMNSDDTSVAKSFTSLINST